MKKVRMMVLAAAAGGIWTASAIAQAPPAPPAAPAPAAAAAATQEKKGFFERVCESIERKKRKLCTTPAGQMLNSMTKPLTMATGGIIPPFCPAMPSKDELAKGGVEGDAARAKKDALEADARRQAVRLLGTFDCHWHPEAQDALIAALRTDRFECVRLEAAISLNRACCCSAPVIAALMDSVSCGEKFGPSENSPRVQMVAAMALERCLSCYIETSSADDDKKMEEKKDDEEVIPKPKKNDDPNAPAVLKPISVESPTAADKKLAYVSRKPSRELIEKGKIVLEEAKVRLANVPMSPQILPSGQRSLFHIANYALEGRPETRQPAVAMPPAPAKISSAIANSKPVAKPATPSKTVNTSTPAPAQKPPEPKPEESAMAAPRVVDPTVLKCLETLRDAEDPEVRHTAVRNLAAKDWHEHPEVVLGLLYSARQDQHPGMRVVCIRYLASIQANTPEVVTCLQSLSQDTDAWIRKEAQQALGSLQK